MLLALDDHNPAGPQIDAKSFEAGQVEHLLAHAVDTDPDPTRPDHCRRPQWRFRALRPLPGVRAALEDFRLHVERSTRTGPRLAANAHGKARAFARAMGDLDRDGIPQHADRHVVHSGVDGARRRNVESPRGATTRIVRRVGDDDGAAFMREGLFDDVVDTDAWRANGVAQLEIPRRDPVRERLGLCKVSIGTDDDPAAAIGDVRPREAMRDANAEDPIAALKGLRPIRRIRAWVTRWYQSGPSIGTRQCAMTGCIPAWRLSRPDR